MNYLSLFSGIGGIDLGLDRAGMRCVGQVECDPFALAVLEQHWPGVPKFTDVRTFGRKDLDGPVELICGGFPCQDISVAGKGRQLEGERSGLWWEFERIVREFKPSWVIAENVPALRNRGADDVLSSLEAAGYAAWPVVVGAEHVGAPHRRHRVWIVGYTESVGGSREPSVADAGRSLERAVAGATGGTDERDTAARIPSRGRTDAAGAGAVDDSQRARRLAGRRDARDEEETRRGRGEPAESDQVCELADAASGGQRILRSAQRPTAADVDGGGAVVNAAGERRAWGNAPIRQGGGNGLQAAPSGSVPPSWPARPGEPQHEWEAARLVELPLGGAVDGVPVRLLRAANRNALKAFGNSVCPQIPELIGQWILSLAGKAGAA